MECGFRCRRTLSQLYDASRDPTVRRCRCYTGGESPWKEEADMEKVESNDGGLEYPPMQPLKDPLFSHSPQPCSSHPTAVHQRPH